MKICDRCDRATPRLEELIEEFESLEVCPPCAKQLTDIMIKIGDDLSRERARRRAAAFAEWRQKPK